MTELSLSSFPFAGELSTEERRRLLETTVVRRVPKGGYVCNAGDPVTDWYGVMEGLVKLGSVSREGKAVTFVVVRGGGWFGEGSLLKDEPRRYDGVAMRDCIIACVPKSTFQFLLDGSLSFNGFILTQLNERLAQFIGMVEFGRLHRQEVRLAHEITSLFNMQLYPSTQARLEISQEEIAHIVGMSRQRVNRALLRLEQEGLLIVRYGEIEVVDMDRLRRFKG